MLSISHTSKFKIDHKRTKRHGKDVSRLESVLDLLARKEALPESMRDHLPGGACKDHRECHIKSDCLLIYPIDESELSLVSTRTGSHSELFMM